MPIEWVLFQAQTCEKVGRRIDCFKETYYTQDAFRTPPKRLLSRTSSCLFALSSQHFKPAGVPDERIFCIASAGSDNGKADGGYSRESRLFKSDDWFDDEADFVDLGIGKRAQGIVGLGVSGKFMVVALKPGRVDPLAARSPAGGSGDSMHLYTSVDAKTWNMARFPSTHNLREKYVKWNLCSDCSD